MLRVRRHGLVVGGFLGVFGDYVPGVQQAGDETEAAEGEVDEGVGGADAGFDPDCLMMGVSYGREFGESEGWEFWNLGWVKGGAEGAYLRWGGRGWRSGRGKCRCCTWCFGWKY